MKIICVGRIKERFFKEAIKEYQKRISKYVKLEIIEILDYNTTDINKDLSKEKDNIFKYISEKDYVITLEIEGKTLTSEELAKKLEETKISNSNITFIIGSSYGLHQEVKNRSNYKLSFSKMTFPHQLFRVILLEQIYRSFKINNHEEYHK